MSGPIPSEAITLIQEFEGCGRLDPGDGLLHAYPDPGTGDEPYTIGWGTTVLPDGRPVRRGDAITREEADRIFLRDLQSRFWEPISRTIPHWQAMNDPMRAALCSFAYNLGAGFYGAEGFTTISACLREQRWPELPAALLLYVNPGSSVEAGLRRRREAEGRLWRQGLQQRGGDPAAGEGSEILVARTQTFLKKNRVDSSQLPPHQLVAVETGRQWKIAARLELSGQSQRVRLAYGAGDWWIYLPHWSTLPAPAAPLPDAAPERPPLRAKPPEDETSAAADPLAGTGRDLAVPYLSQLDNRCNPFGSCNVTCVAMCLYYLGMPRRAGSELEDELYRRMETLGRDRHDPYDLQFLIGTYPGFHDIFRVNGGFGDIRASIDAGHPVIVHGYFTRSGHIIVIRGYDERGFWVNDPYGEYFSSGYDTSRTGERLHYSYGLIARTCSPESQADPANIWFHTVLKV